MFLNYLYYQEVVVGLVGQVAREVQVDTQAEVDQVDQVKQFNMSKSYCL